MIMNALKFIVKLNQLRETVSADEGFSTIARNIVSFAELLFADLAKLS